MTATSRVFSLLTGNDNYTQTKKATSLNKVIELEVKHYKSIVMEERTVLFNHSDVATPVHLIIVYIAPKGDSPVHPK